MNLLLFVVLGLAAGILSGLFGIGGGINEPKGELKPQEKTAYSFLFTLN